MSTKKSYLAKLYVGTAEAAIGALTEAKIVGNVTVSMSNEISEFNTRESRFKQKHATLGDVQITCQLKCDPSNTAYQTIRDAWIAGSTIEVAALSEDRGTTGAQGPKGRFSVANFTREEEINGILQHSVTFDPELVDEYLEI